MKKIQQLLFFILLFSVLTSYGQRGKDGNKNVNTANTIVNEYTTLTTDVAAGNTTIIVAASGLNANNRFAGTLAPGDLIMIIQMQGATILGQQDTVTPPHSVPNDFTWGSVTNYNNCGNYELCQVASVPTGSTIAIDCGLLHDYTAAGKTQIVRVPRYASLNIAAPGVLTCQAWNGTIGGVLAVEVQGATTVTAGGKISATGKGFRGGALCTPPAPRSQTLYYSSTNSETSANKGEGIAGYDNDYTIFGGKYCRGAAANAGGAGNVWNSGGGGGANAGPVGSWTGQGIPDTSVAGWSAAWNLEAPSFATSSSSGGGRGGYSFSAYDKDATLDPPNSLVWGGYARVPVGGLGGRPLDYSTGKIFMGGGGGGGEQDNNQGGAGGAGGGIIYFSAYGTITGSGNDSIIADGNNGGNAQAPPPLSSYSGKDAAGGAGAGGTILINSAGITGMLASARGGKGGNQILARGSFYFGAMNEAEGPGGGGGGGYIALASGSITQLVNGGANGTTNSDGLTEFIPDGATKGAAGLMNQVLAPNDSIVTNNVTICSGDSTVLTAIVTGGTPGILNWYSAATGGTLFGTDSITTPALTSTTTYYVGLCPGAYRIPVVVTVLSGTPSVSIIQNTTGVICPGSPITFTASIVNGGTAPVYSWFVNGVASGTNDSTFTSSVLNDGDTVVCQMTSNSFCSNGTVVSSNSVIVSITPAAPVSVSITASPAGAICTGTPVTFTAVTTNGGSTPSYQWQLNGGNVGANTASYNNSTLANGDVITCTVTSNANCATGSPAMSNTITTLVNALPTPSITSDVNVGCVPTCVQFTETSGVNYNSVVYHFGDGDSATTLSPQHCYNLAGTYSASITCTDSNGCTGTTLVNNMITVIPNTASVSITQSPTGTICPGTTVTFTATPFNGGSNPTYSWFVNGVAMGSNSDTFTSTTLLNNDTVICSMVPNSVCASTTPVLSNPIVVIITPSVTALVSITSNPAGAICAGTPVTFNATPVNGGTAPHYQWQVNGANVGTNSTNYSTSSLTNGTAVHCIMTSNADCVLGSPATSNTITMVVNPLPAPNISANTFGGCSPLCVQFTETTGVTYNSINYSFGDGNTSSIAAPQNCYTQVGSYTVSVSCIDANNCTGTASFSNLITVSPPPVADFTIAPGETVTANSIVTFTNTSSNSNSALWNFGDPSIPANDTSTQLSPTHTYADAGNYCIELTVQNLVGCSDTTQKCITVTNDAMISIPNVFTPNGDGKNDVFFITCTAIKKLECSIYDRWGLKVAEFNSVDGTWNGHTKSGAKASEGVYYYSVKATGEDGKEFDKQGFIQLTNEK